MPARDLARSAAFYRKLGFTAELITEPPGYLIVRQDWVELHFYPDDGVDPLTNASGAYIRL
ncbi:MAG: VOC family protein, partial [Verrucomicrobiae bacterium]|nr:VOC family protein [Verrucomicrobiae bacterium]